MEAAMAVEDRQQMLMANFSQEFVSRVGDFARHKEEDSASGAIFHDKGSQEVRSKL